jgi:hypothetical protein
VQWDWVIGATKHRRTTCQPAQKQKTNIAKQKTEAAMPD